MANRTVKDAHTVHGTNPQYLVEKIIRSRIYESKYWKEECFAVTAELIVDKGMELRYCGGVYGGNIKPTPFMCLLLKMLQIQPEKDIVIEFLRQEDFKYIRALAALYLRLTATALDIYKYLEPLYNDYRKIRFQNREGNFVLSTMDQFVDDLLIEERACDIILPRLQKRHVLEESSALEPRVSLLDDDNEDDDGDEEIAEEAAVAAMEIEMQKIANRRQQRDRDNNPHDDVSQDRRSERRKDNIHNNEKDRERDRDRRQGAGHNGQKDHRDPERRRRNRTRSRDRSRERENQQQQQQQRPRRDGDHRCGYHRNERDRNRGDR
ncbi:pre-mRNA-splicing factor 38A-like, partial [Tropilaelaps mercedesae]